MKSDIARPDPIILPSVSGKEVKVDITIREKIVYPVEEKIILRG
jgi:hypothetical protein